MTTRLEKREYFSMDHSGEAILEGADLDPNIDETSQRFIRYHCVEASATLKPYLQWMADIIRADPGNADNLSMIKMVIFLFGCLKDPDESMREIERVESSTTSLDRKMDKGKIEEYRQLYPFFAKTVRELESAVAAAVPHSPEVRPFFRLATL